MTKFVILYFDYYHNDEVAYIPEEEFKKRFKPYKPPHTAQHFDYTDLDPDDDWPQYDYLLKRTCNEARSCVRYGEEKLEIVLIGRYLQEGDCMCLNCRIEKKRY